MTPTPWTEAQMAAALFAIEPRTGGMAVRALPGPVRDRLVALVRSYLPQGAPLRRVPLHVTDDRLLGGLDLAATLQAGCPVTSRGLLAEADGGVLLVAMAERMPISMAARFAAAMDTGAVVVERDGFGLRSPAAFGVVALDEGLADDENPPAALLERLAFLTDLDGVGLRDATPALYDKAHVEAGRALLPAVTIPDDLLQALCGTAAKLGVQSVRASLLALRAAAAAAALGARSVVTEADAMAAMRLVLAPRATLVPAPPADRPQDAPAPERGGADAAESDDTREEGPAAAPIGEIMLEAAKAAMPAGLMARLLAGPAARSRRPSPGGAGDFQQSLRRGRPVGVRRGELAAGARLNLIETLRTAAPWQTLRRRGTDKKTVVVVKDDFRVTRFRRRTEATTIFVVDASGSAALNRLAEAKGAVELVLADCYVRRDRVALISFRGAGAELLLPPTTSLVRAKRSLAGLPGGGGTPLALGIEAAFTLADALRRKGQSPVIVMLSDGRANVARDGSQGRVRAEADAIAASRQLRGAGLASVLIDTSPRPAAHAKRLAEEMGGLYLPLPYADAVSLASAIRASVHA